MLVATKLIRAVTSLACEMLAKSLTWQRLANAKRKLEGACEMPDSQSDKRRDIQARHCANLTDSKIHRITQMDTMSDLISIVEDQGASLDAFKSKQNSRLSEVEHILAEIEKKAGRPNFGAGTAFDGGPKNSAQNEVFFDAKTQKAIPVLSNKQSLVALEKNSSIETPSLGRLLRGIVLGGQAADAGELMEERKSLGINGDPSGGYTVSGALSNQWIDALRANMVLSKAGCLTLPMEAGEVSIARVITDPTCSWHAENGSLTNSGPTFGKMTLSAKTVACVIRLSVELGQDAVNIESQLQNVITKAMAGAIDSAGLVGLNPASSVIGGPDDGVCAGPSGIMNLSGRNIVSSVGAPTSWDFVLDGMYELMLDNVPSDKIGAFIAHPAVWKKMAKLKTGISSDKTTLAQPAEVAAIPKLWTTAAPLVGGTTAAGIMGNWSDLIMGVRQQITVRVLSEAYMASNLQLTLLAYARVDFAAARQESFVTLEGISV